VTKKPPFRETAVNHRLHEITGCLDEGLQSRVMDLARSPDLGGP
jgi:hypothetical protein